MRIQIRQAEERGFTLLFPTGLAFNRLTAGLLARGLEEQGVKMDRRQAAAFVKALNRYRRSHKGWVLVELESADGDKVKIQL